MRVAIDQDILSPVTTRKMQLCHAIERQALEKIVGVVTVIDGVGVKVRHIEEKPRVRLFEKFCDKVGFAHLRTGEGHRVCNIFQQERYFDQSAHDSNVPTEGCDGFAGKWYR